MSMNLFEWASAQRYPQRESKPSTSTWIYWMWPHILPSMTQNSKRRLLWAFQWIAIICRHGVWSWFAWFPMNYVNNIYIYIYGSVSLIQSCDSRQDELAKPPNVSRRRMCRMCSQKMFIFNFWTCWPAIWYHIEIFRTNFSIRVYLA